MSKQIDTRSKWLSALLLILISTPVIINTAVLAIDSLNSTNFSGLEIAKKVS
ncbi:MAG: hypothetical protein GOU99_01930, partial [Candidatus Altiarchaeota archaeon]|nr:hypothetical protein [Candidatus Altiarchaeota archaeon]